MILLDGFLSDNKQWQKIPGSIFDTDHLISGYNYSFFFIHHLTFPNSSIVTWIEQTDAEMIMSCVNQSHNYQIVSSDALTGTYLGAGQYRTTVNAFAIGR